MKLEDRLESLSSMNVTQLAIEWSNVNESTRPNVPASLLRRLIAQRLQEKRHRSLPVLVVRELDAIAAGGTQAIGKAASVPKVVIRPSTRLMREWNGQTISVIALDDGFEYEGKYYSSLSQIAQQVTGAHWLGPRFFGLVKRSDARG